MMLRISPRLIFTLCVTLGGCTDLDEFATKPGEVYSGTVFGTTSPEPCPEGDGCSFIRRGFAERTTLELSFTPDDEDQAGTISTLNEPCDRTFDAVPLLRIEPLQHDSLSLLDFPGEGRLETQILLATPRAGRLANRTTIVFLSLMRSGKVEARIIAGDGTHRCNPSDCSTNQDCDYFGVFSLARPQ